METIVLKWRLKKDEELYGYRFVFLGGCVEYDIEKGELEVYRQENKLNIIDNVQGEVELGEDNKDKEGSYAKKMTYRGLQEYI